MSINPIRMPKQRRAQRTRDGLLLAGQKELSEHGYAHATAKRIAARAGVSTGSFYQYFRDKDALLRELASVRFQSTSERVSGLFADAGVHDDAAELARAQFTGVVDYVIDLHREDPGLHTVLTERRYLDTELDGIISAAEVALIGEIEQLIRQWRPDSDAESLAFVLFHMVEGSVHAHVLGTPMVSDARFLDVLVTSVIRLVMPAST